MRIIFADQWTSLSNWREFIDLKLRKTFLRGLCRKYVNARVFDGGGGGGLVRKWKITRRCGDRFVGTFRFDGHKETWMQSRLSVRANSCEIKRRFRILFVFCEFVDN